MYTLMHMGLCKQPVCKHDVGHIALQLVIQPEYFFKIYIYISVYKFISRMGPQTHMNVITQVRDE